MYDLVKLSKSEQLDAWRELFDLSIDELKKIQSVLNRDFKDRTLFPDPENVFRAFELIKPEDVNVIILGQDPYMDYINVFVDENGEVIFYPTIDQRKKCKKLRMKRADGLAFSSRTEVSPSLINIYKEIDSEFGCNIRKAKELDGTPLGDLSKWCEQGVMLLNSSLLAIDKNEKVLGIWHGFLLRVVNYIQEFNQDCIFMLWGKYAIDLGESLGISGILIRTSHPSPKSANRPVGEFPSFLGSEQFVICNEELKKLKKKEINWCS